jgi:predicted RNA methylase
MGVVDMDMLWEMELDTILVNFQESKNPLFVWEAFKFCRDNGKEIPDWVFEYFGNVASNLISLSERERMSDQRAADEVYGALEMSKLKPRDIFDRFSLYKRNQNIVQRICNLIEDKKKKVTHAITAVSEQMELEYGTVRKIFYDWLNDGVYTKDKTARYGLPENFSPPPDYLNPDYD